jgi:hypothetical protein
MHVWRNLFRREKVEEQLCSFVVCQEGDGVVGFECDFECFGFHPWEREKRFFYLKLLKLKGVEYVWSLMVTENKKAWFGGEWMFKC